MLGKQEDRSVFGSKDDHRRVTKEYTPEDAKRDQDARLERRKLRQHMMFDGSMMNDADMPRERFAVMPRVRPSKTNAIRFFSK
jgi:hypothetical protein